jgi:hypothetical protein
LSWLASTSASRRCWGLEVEELRRVAAASSAGAVVLVLVLVLRAARASNAAVNSQRIFFAVSKKQPQNSSKIVNDQRNDGSREVTKCDRSVSRVMMGHFQRLRRSV